MWRHVCRIALGLFAVFHAFAHTVLLLRGEIDYPPSAALPAIAVSAFLVALIALTAAGAAILGSRVFRGLEGTLIAVGVSGLWRLDAASREVATVCGFMAARGTARLPRAAT